MDDRSKELRSQNMARIRAKGNQTTELRLIQIMRTAGITGWRRHQALPGKPDFIFRKERLAIFVDGCFWHGCPKCFRLPQDNRDYWYKKISNNKQRDRAVTKELNHRGWKVLRIWEHSLRPGNEKRTAHRILFWLNKNQKHNC